MDWQQEVWQIARLQKHFLMMSSLLGVLMEPLFRLRIIRLQRFLKVSGLRATVPMTSLDSQALMTQMLRMFHPLQNPMEMPFEPFP